VSSVLWFVVPGHFVAVLPVVFGERCRIGAVCAGAVAGVAAQAAAEGREALHRVAVGPACALRGGLGRRERPGAMQHPIEAALDIADGTQLESVISTSADPVGDVYSPSGSSWAYTTV
jgi:hypothetical protein